MGVRQALSKCSHLSLCKSSADTLDDTNVDAVIARNLWKNHRLLPPTSKSKQNWDVVMVRPLPLAPPGCADSASDSDSARRGRPSWCLTRQL